MYHLIYIQIIPNYLYSIYNYLNANAGLNNDYPYDVKTLAAPNAIVIISACSNFSSENLK